MLHEFIARFRAWLNGDESPRKHRSTWERLS